MRFKKSLTTLLMGASLAFGGCDNSSSNSATSQPSYKTISGKPLSVAVAYGSLNGSLSTVIENNTGKILAFVPDYFGSSTRENCSKAEALIQSEINDKDNEDIELTGRYETNTSVSELKPVFIITTVKANGYTIDFRD